MKTISAHPEAVKERAAWMRKVRSCFKRIEHLKRATGAHLLASTWMLEMEVFGNGRVKRCRSRKGGL